jgi:hypothetical protein
MLSINNLKLLIFARSKIKINLIKKKYGNNS